MKHLLSVLFCTCFSIYLIAQQSVEWGNWKNWGDQGDGTYINPIIPSDYSDIDCIRVGEDYYAISSTFQFSPGMTLLHSKDLVNWEILLYKGNLLLIIKVLQRINFLPTRSWDFVGKKLWISMEDEV